MLVTSPRAGRMRAMHARLKKQVLAEPIMYPSTKPAAPSWAYSRNPVKLSTPMPLECMGREFYFIYDRVLRES
jgi:hypothetical protein